jgi:hypothetical protein
MASGQLIDSCDGLMLPLCAELLQLVVEEHTLLELKAYFPSASMSLPELIRAIRGQIPDKKCDLLEDLVLKLQKRELRLNRQEFLHRVKDIAGDGAPLFRMVLKQLAVERRTAPSEQASHLRPLMASDCASDE